MFTRVEATVPLRIPGIGRDLYADVEIEEGGKVVIELDDHVVAERLMEFITTNTLKELELGIVVSSAGAKRAEEPLTSWECLLCDFKVRSHDDSVSVRAIKDEHLRNQHDL
jgi:hypothetical protein